MNNHTTWKALVLAAVLAALVGCVSPGRIAPTLVNRYQHALTKLGPLQRVGVEGLDMLRPLSPVPGPTPLVEEIVPRRSVVTTTVTHREVGRVVRERRELREVEVTTTVKRKETTFVVRDPETGEETILEERERSEVTKEVKELSDVPEDFETVEAEEDRVGRESWTPALTSEIGKMFHLGLDVAILLALVNSEQIHVASYDPAIAREEMVKAAAEFDYVVGGSFTSDQRDERTDSQFGGGMSDTRTWALELKQKAITGGDWSLAWSMTRTWDNQLFRNLPTRFEPRMVFQVTQPLLRDAWPAFNLARLGIAQVNRDISEETFRQRVEEVITEVISTYWILVQTRRNLEIQRLLLKITINTMNRIRGRLGVDATQVELKQAEAQVALRSVALLQFEKTVLDVQDRLARLLADPRINTLSEVEIFPTTEPNTAEVKLDLTDQLVTALHYSPVLEQARLAVSVANINVEIAENQTLPRLQFAASAGLQGLEGKKHEAEEKFWTGNYFSYSVGLMFEYPIGNRERIAQLRQQKYERLKAIDVMQDVADQVGVLVKERIRQVRESFRELADQRKAVQAAIVQLQALETAERLRRALTPAFLQTKLQAQETLAEAGRGEVQAIVNYNIALVELARATGTVMELQGVRLGLPVAMGVGRWSVKEDQKPSAEELLRRVTP